MNPMRRLARLLSVAFLVSALVLLAACAERGVRREINPPRASVQELAVQPDGQWRLSVRLQNFSNVATTFVDVDAALDLGGQSAGQVRAQPALVVGPNSAEVVTVVLAPSAAAKTAVASSLAGGRAVRYRLAGRIRTQDPDGNHAFEYDSSLNPVPGLDGVLR
jgi:hypothetical protein